MIKKLALAAILAVCGSAAQAGTPVQSFNVAIDGHCNTFHLNIGGLLVAGSRGGCGPAGLMGGTVATVDGKLGVVVSETVQGMVVTWYFTQPQEGAGKVFVFGSDGKSATELGQGTYHLVHRTKVRQPGGNIMREFQR